MASARNNRFSLDDIRTMPVGEIAKLPAEHLALLQQDADAALDAAKRLKEWREGAIALRYADTAATVRRAEGMRLPPPSAAAISRMEATLPWLRWLEIEDAKLVWMRAERLKALDVRGSVAAKPKGKKL